MVCELRVGIMSVCLAGKFIMISTNCPDRQANSQAGDPGGRKIGPSKGILQEIYHTSGLGHPPGGPTHLSPSLLRRGLGLKRNPGSVQIIDAYTE